jgi:hypothetical protein
MQAKDLFAVVADERKFPFLREDAGAMEGFCCVGRCIDGGPVDSRRLTQLPKIKVDLDTGELSGPDGVDLKGLRLLSVRLTFTLRTEAGLEVWKIDVDRNFPDKRVKLYVYTQQKNARDDCRERLASLESKLKLASRLREAKAKKDRRSESQPEKPK